MSRKITKKELKQPDPFQLSIARTMQFISTHKQKIYIIISVFTLIFLISAGWYLYRENTEKKAQILYTKAYLTTLNSSPDGSKIDPGNLKLYQDVISQYPGSKAARIAYYQIGNLNYRLNDIEGAIKAYQEYLKKASDDNELIPLVYIGLGYCFENKKDYPKALDYFEKVLKTKSAANYANINLRNIARIYEKQNNKEKALEYYQKALERTSDPFVNQYIKRKISTLG